MNDLKAKVNDEQYEEALFKYGAADVLYIDDFMKQEPTKADKDNSFELINLRVVKNKRTIITSERALDEIKQVRWDPAWGEERISNMIATRPNWCISRQRVWGVPIAVLFCTGCKQVLNLKEVNRAVVDLFAREGADSWYRRDVSEIVPAGTKCPNCGGEHFRKEMDIIDVWFESGSSYLAVHNAEGDMPWPSSLYLEGAISIAAGFTLPCCAPSEPGTARLTRWWPPMGGRWTRRGGPCLSPWAMLWTRTILVNGWVARLCASGWRRWTFARMCAPTTT
jgi:hypothetical protein